MAGNEYWSFLEGINPSSTLRFYYAVSCLLPLQVQLDPGKFSVVLLQLLHSSTHTELYVLIFNNNKYSSNLYARVILKGNYYHLDMFQFFLVLIYFTYS